MSEGFVHGPRKVRVQVWQAGLSTRLFSGYNEEELREKVAKASHELMCAEQALVDFMASTPLSPDLSSLSDMNGTSRADLTRASPISRRYGFISRSEGCRFDSASTSAVQFAYGPPSNAISLALQQFNRNLRAIFGNYDAKERGYELTAEIIERQESLSKLSLDAYEIKRREDSRLAAERASGGPCYTPPLFIKLPYDFLVSFIDFLFDAPRATPIERFYFLEVVARIPYFSYISMLHLYETLGWWRRSVDVKKVHFAEETNEYHHLLLMEALGGDQRWIVRFLAQHAAIAYYWVLILLFIVSPSAAYGFSVLLESHAVETYEVFLEENQERLARLPPPSVITDYYDSLQYYLASDKNVINYGSGMQSLSDVFAAVRDDEEEHVQTMLACMNPQSEVLAQENSRAVAVLGVVAAALVASGVLLGGEGVPVNGEELDAEVDLGLKIMEALGRVRL